MISPSLHPGIRQAAFTAELIWWAKRYAASGFPVFPVSGKKIPHVKWKTTGGTTDFKQIDYWWSIWPLAMIGMATGARTGLVVLDVDTKNGVNGFETMRLNGWKLDANALEVRTPSGGSHFYFKLKPGQVVRNSVSKIGPGLDIRGDGGMVILPPSRPTLDAPDYCFVKGQEPAPEPGRFTW